MNHNCPHGNRNCGPATPCTPCSGVGVLKDGERIVAPMALMDSMQRLVAGNQSAVTDEIRAQARADHEVWKRQQQTQSSAKDDAYARMCADLQDSWKHHLTSPGDRHD